MGPLVPDFIGNELNYIVAFLIGIAFGFILEQAGFSTSKKLVGLFYGYDFTVLRVFFTAGVTAMIGVIVLDHFHMIDLSSVFINPFFLWSALVGGVIMGLGFILGGFCPGTSLAAAAIGKIDAMIFVAGSFLGVLLFAEGYPWFEDLYKATNFGSPRVFETLQMSQGLFAALMVIVAVGAFILVTMIEKRVNKGEAEPTLPKKLVMPLVGVSLLVSLSAFFVPPHQEHIEDIKAASLMSVSKVPVMSVDELALRLMNSDPSIQLVDVRSEEAFKQFALPHALHGDITAFINRDWRKVFNTRGKTVVLYADTESDARKAAMAAEDLGYKNFKILQGGLDSFRSEILQFKKPEGTFTIRLTDLYRFREKAALVLPQIIESAKPKVVQKKSSRVLGGC